jgi:hypothetical protein
LKQGTVTAVGSSTSDIEWPSGATSAAVPGVFGGVGARVWVSELDGHMWVSSAVGGGAATFVTYAPSLTQSGAVTHTVTAARYSLAGGMVNVRIRLAVTGAGTGNNPIQVTLPVLADSSSGFIGTGAVVDTGSGLVIRALVSLATTGIFQFFRADSTGITPIGQDPNFALANTDTVEATLSYVPA